MRDRRILRAAIVIWLVQQLVVVIVVLVGFHPSMATFFAIEAAVLAVCLVTAVRWYLPPKPK
jgi:hypothetical protein